ECNKSYLRFPNRRRVTFSCLSKRKSPKRRTPRMAQAVLALLGIGALAEPQDTPCPVARERSSLTAPLTGSPQCLAVLEPRHTGTQLHPRQRLRQALAEGSRDAQPTHHRRSYLCHA